MGIEQPANDNAREQSVQQSVMSMSDAIAQIGLFRQQVESEGAVDTEREELSNILIDVMHSKITPAEGVQKAQALVNARSTYH